MPSEVPPFVRNRGDFLEPLLLSFPIDLLRAITRLLTATHVKNLVLAGSTHLNALLQLKGGIECVHLVSTAHCSLDRVVTSSFFKSFGALTTFVFNVMDTQSIAPEWKISMLPSTLTHLHVQQPLAIFPFTNLRLEFISNRKHHSELQSQLENAQERIANYAASDAHYLLPIAQLFPKLQYLAILGNYRDERLDAIQLHSLPMTLQTIHAPRLLLQPASSLYPIWEFLPPLLTSLECYTVSPASLSPLPTQITHLGLSRANLALSDRHPEFFPYGAVHTWNSLVCLKCPDVTIADKSVPVAEQFFPPTLETLEINNLQSHKVIEHLPKSLTSLTISLYAGELNVILGLIKVPLQHLSYRGNLYLASYWALLPRSLKSLVLLSIGDWTFDHRMPPHIESICATHASLYDHEIAKLPSSVTKLGIADWHLTGALLPPNTVAVDDALLKHSLLRHPYVHLDYIRNVIIKPLESLPDTCESVRNVSILTHLPVAQLPSSIRSLPKSYCLSDDGSQDFSDLPRSVTKLSVGNGMKISSWLTLPASVTTVRGGVVALTEDDVMAFMAHLKQKEEDDNPISTVHIPNTIYDTTIQRLASQLQGLPSVAKMMKSKPLVVRWQPKHISMLPDSVTCLSLSPSANQHDTRLLNGTSSPSSSQTQHEDTLNAENFITKFPASLTSLTIGDDCWKHGNPLPRRKIQREMKKSMVLAQSGVSLSALPSTLVTLELFGGVLLRDLEPISRLFSLEVLALGPILDRSASPSSTRRRIFYQSQMRNFIATLPSQLKTLRILEYDTASKLLRSLRDGQSSSKTASPPSCPPLLDIIPLLSTAAPKVKSKQHRFSKD